MCVLLAFSPAECCRTLLSVYYAYAENGDVSGRINVSMPQDVTCVASSLSVTVFSQLMVAFRAEL